MNAKGEWVDYLDLPQRLQMQAHLMRPRWAREDFQRFSFLVRPSGDLSKGCGHHQWTKHECERLDQKAAALFEHKPERGSISHYRTASFGLNKEPV